MAEPPGHVIPRKVGGVIAGWATGPDGDLIPPQSEVDVDAEQDYLVAESFRMQRLERRRIHAAKWAALPGPDSWTRLR